MEISIRTIAILMACMLGACSTAPANRSALMSEVEGIDVTKRELEIAMYSFAVHVTGQIELACSEIYTSSSDPDIRRAAIEWNTNASPEWMKACFYHDPLVAMISAWVFAIQMREFFQDGNGRDVFGAYQPIATQVSTSIEGDMFKLAHAVWSALGRNS